MRQTGNRWGATGSAAKVVTESGSNASVVTGETGSRVQIGPDPGNNVHSGTTVPPQARAVIQAVCDGAESWSAAGRQAGVSRQQARRLGLRYGGELPPAASALRVPGGRVTRAIRVRAESDDLIAGAARAWGVTPSEAYRRVLAAGVSALGLADQPMPPPVTDPYDSGYDDASE